MIFLIRQGCIFIEKFKNRELKMMNLMVRKNLSRLSYFPTRSVFKTIWLNGKPFEVPESYVGPYYDVDKIKNASKVVLLRHANTLFNLDYV